MQAVFLERRNILFCFPSGFPRIQFQLTLKRLRTYYVMNVILPVIFLSLTASLVFYLPAEAGEKIGMSMTVLLAYAVYLTIIADNMPQTSLQVEIHWSRIGLLYALIYLPRYPYFFMSLSLSLSLLSLSLSLALSQSLLPSLCLSLCLSFFLSLYFSLSQSHFLPHSLYFSLCLSFSLSVSLSLYPSPFLSLSLSLFLSQSLFLSLPLSPTC